MSFTLTCDKCGQKQLLKAGDFYDKENISLENDHYEELWEALSITCNSCGNSI